MSDEEAPTPELGGTPALTRSAGRDENGVRDGRGTKLRRVSALLVVLAVALGFAALTDRARERALGERGATAAYRLGLAAGLRARGGATAGRPLPITVVQEGGPLWAGPVLGAAFDADAAFSLGESPHLLRIEVVADERNIVIAPALFRQGWGLRLESPLRIRLVPWIATTSALMGLGLLLGLRRPAGEGLLAAGAAAQLLTWIVPWPQPLQHQNVGAALEDGPLGAALVDFATSLSDGGVAVAIGGIVMCTVLVAFDHRRSRARGGATLVRGIGGALGLLLWFEASARTGLTGWGSTAAGAAALGLVFGGWVLGILSARRA